MARNTYYMKKASAFPLRKESGSTCGCSLSVVEHPPLLKAHCKYIYGGLSSWTWNVACNLKVNVLSQQSLCCFGVWQQKGLRKRFPCDPNYFFHTNVYESVCTFLSTQSCTWCQSCYNTSLPAEGEGFLPLRAPPTAQSPALHSALCCLCDWSGSWASPEGQKRRKEEKAGTRKKIPSPFDGSKIS